MGTRLDLRRAVKRRAVPFVVKRYPDAGTETGSGLKIESVAAPFLPDFRASVHPAPGELLNRLPEGQRNFKTIVVYTVFSLRMADASAGLRGDLIEFESEDYEIQELKFWDQGQYFEYVAQKVDR